MTGKEMPEVLDANVDIWDLLKVADTQWLVSFGGVFGVNMQTVRDMAYDLSIERDWLFYHKIKAYEQETLKHMSGSKDGPCNEDKKNQCRELYGEYFESTCRKCEVMKNGKSGS